MKKIFVLILAMLMVVALAACGNEDTPAPSNGDEPGTSQEQPSNTPDDRGWFTGERLSVCGLSGLKQPDGITINESSDTNVSMNGMTDTAYRAWLVEAYELITEQRGAVYEPAGYDDSFNITSFKKMATLSESGISTDGLPTFDLVYKYGDSVYSLYIVYYPVDYNGESAGYAEIRLSDVTSIWGSLPFND